MKKIVSILFAFLLLLSVPIMAYDYDDGVDSNGDGVGIAPIPADAGSAIYAVLDYDVDSPVYTWEKNGREQTDYTGSSVSASALEAGDVWKVTVSYYTYTGEYTGWVEVDLGTETVVLEGDGDDGEGIVYILPNPAYEDEDITCYYDFDLGDGTAIYTWEQDGSEESSLTGQTVDDSWLDAGEYWTCTISYITYAGEYVGYLEVEIGSDTVEILERSDDDDNEGPTLDPIADVTVYEGETVDVTATATDPEGDELSFAFVIWGVALNDYTSSEDGTLTWVTEVGDAGEYPVWVAVNDGYGNYDYGEFTITVLEEPVEDTDAPLVTDIFFTVTEGDFVDVEVEILDNILTWSFHSMMQQVFESTTVYVYDGDSDASDLSWTYDQLLNADGDWQTSEGDAGQYTVIITVSDETGNSSDGTIDITVEEDTTGNGGDDENECPTLTVEDVEVEEGELVEAVYEAEDPEGDELTFYFSEPLDEDGQWQTEEGDAGVYEAYVAVTDGDEACLIVEYFTITVNPVGSGDDNTAPEVEEIDDVEVDEGETVTVEVVATDDDGDELTYTFEGLEDRDVVVEDNVLTWETGYTDAGQYDVTVIVSDGELEASTSFEIKVNDVCDDEDGDGICDEDSIFRSNYEGDKLAVNEIVVLNANDLYSAYDVSDLELDVSGVFYIEDDYLYSTGSDNVIYVEIELQNKNSFDAEQLQITFVLDSETYYAEFADLDRGEESSAVYAIEIPEGLESGKYALHIVVENDDLYNYEAVNLEITSMGDYIEYESGSSSEPTSQSFWERLMDFLF